MKVLVTGVAGQLGYDVVKALKIAGHEALGYDKNEMDLTKKKEIQEVILNAAPDGIIHCGAYTAVDKAEKEIELCYKVNAEATREIALCAKILDIPMIYISTDYVFDGMKQTPYFESDIPNPCNVYGASKLKGEQYVQALLDKYYIVRISWVFGENGHNFVKTMKRLGKEKEFIKVVGDQVGSPTYTKDLAPLLVKMIERDKYGVYHATNEGFCSWYEFAKKIMACSESHAEVIEIKTNDYKTLAKRPMNSQMSKAKLEEAGFSRLRNWEEAVEEYLIFL